MLEDAKAKLRAALLEEGLLRSREGIRLATMVEELQAQGETELAEATREIARRNELELMKLRERYKALNG